MKISDFKLNYKDFTALDCKVPCSLYSVLLEKGLMDDPFYGMNEEKIKKLSYDDCEFTSVFNVDEETFEKNNILLRFNSLDTVCDVFLNGEKLGYCENMHRVFTFDVKNIIKTRENELKIHFYSPIEYIEEKNERNALYTTWVAKEAISGAQHLRKCTSSFGWDWGPQLPDMGIFRDVELISFDDAFVDNFLITQKHKNGRVFLTATTEFFGEADSFKLTFDGNTYESKDGYFEFEAENPKLWWPRGYGEQNLYEIEVDGGENKCTKTIGLREIKLSRNSDEYGKEFTVVVNGIRIFCMGANYIPEDSIMPRIDRKMIENLIKSACDANYNILRIWGGGYYPSDDFYDLCDRYGLLVWQDFMFACIEFRLTKAMKENIEEEVIDNIRRLRHHASLALFCGNNEIEWHGHKDKSKNVADYIALYEGLIPDLIEEYAPDVYYHPSSPTSGTHPIEPNDPNNGDCHYWRVWHSGMPFEDYRSYKFRFLSEYGFQSFPGMKTIETFAEKEDMNIFSEVMENHQKKVGANSRILNYCADEFLYIKDFEKLVYASQLLQATAIKYGVEHLRRNRGICMGSIYWQINDCWPVASWSSIDYYGRWKALHYYAKKFYSPILLSLHEKGTEVTFSVSNETMKDFKGTVKYELVSKSFEVICSGEKEVEIKSLSAKDVIFEDFREKTGDKIKESLLKAVLVDEKGNVVSKQTLIFVKPKRFMFDVPEIKFNSKYKDGKTYLTFKADTFVKGLEIVTKEDVILSDNFFDIENKEGITITVEGKIDIDAIKLNCVNEIHL